MSARPERSLRVLIVEDDPNSRLVLVSALSPLSVEVTLAENGLEAVKAFGRNAFDVILMDLRMPLLDGYEATRMIRSLEEKTKTPRVPVIVVSAHGRDVEITAAREAGADAHLSKPISVPQLLGTVEAWTGAI